MRPPCGTTAGHAAHNRYGEDPCVPCLDAKKDYIRACRITNGTNGAVRVSLDLLRLLLVQASPESVLVARKELGPQTVSAVRRTAQPHRDQVAS